MCNLLFFFLSPPAFTHGELHPHTRAAINTSIKYSLVVASAVFRRQFWLKDHGSVYTFDFAGSQPENVFLDGFLAEAMLGDLRPAHFTCQLLCLGWSFWSLFSSFILKKTTPLQSRPCFHLALQIRFYMHQCLKVGALTHLQLIFSDCRDDV